MIRHAQTGTEDIFQLHSVRTGLAKVARNDGAACMQQLQSICHQSIQLK
jgi:hypothetical protein